MKIMHKIDVSIIGYEKWVETIFDRTVTEEGKSSWYDEMELVITEPLCVIEHYTKLCKEFPPIGERYTLAQIDQAFWCLNGCSAISPTIFDCLVSPNVYCWETGRNLPVALGSRIHCIRSMYYVYSDVVSKLSDEEFESCFDMWWDQLCHNFWGNARSRRRRELSPHEWNKVWEAGQILANTPVETLIAKNDEAASITKRLDELTVDDVADFSYPDLDFDERSILDCVFDTLRQILELQDLRTQQFALHGLGHSRHPNAPELVQNYIDHRSDAWPLDSIQWLEACRDGEVM